MQFIAHNDLNNMVVFLDYNKQQLDGYLEDINRPYSFEEKAKSFGFDAITAKGDDVEAIKEATLKKTDRPLFIVLDTIKGQGVEFIEKFKGNHHIRPNAEVKAELERVVAKLEREGN